MFCGWWYVLLFNIFPQCLQNFKCYDWEVAQTPLKSRRLLQRRSKFCTFLIQRWRLHFGKCNMDRRENQRLLLLFTFCMASGLAGTSLGFVHFIRGNVYPVQVCKLLTCTNHAQTRHFQESWTKCPNLARCQQGVGEGPAAAR